MVGRPAAADAAVGRDGARRRARANARARARAAASASFRTRASTNALARTGTGARARCRANVAFRNGLAGGCLPCDGSCRLQRWRVHPPVPVPEFRTVACKQMG